MQALQKAIAAVRPGVRFRELGDIISQHVGQHKYQVADCMNPMISLLAGCGTCSFASLWYPGPAGCAVILWAWHWRPLPLRAEHPPLCPQQGAVHAPTALVILRNGCWETSGSGCHNVIALGLCRRWAS